MNFRPEPEHSLDSPWGTHAGEDASASPGRTAETVEAQSIRAHRSVCLWLGHYFVMLTLFRLFYSRPDFLRRALALESLVALVLFYGVGLLIHRLVPRMGGLENVGLLLLAIALGNNVFLMAWLPGEVQLVNFVLVQVVAGVTLRSTWRFVLAQCLCVGLALASLAHWVDPGLLTGNSFIILSATLLSTLIWRYLNRLIAALSQLREKDRVILRQRTRLVRELRDSLANIRTLRGLIPICAHCKRVRDDAGFWQQVEAYVHERSGAKFSHSICPSCMVDVADDFRRMGIPLKSERKA
ncbi:MAG: hypothetical protein HXX12_15440 [Geothrix sp.]|uniref:hypothetical protein n=1 Tax=Geothrix sp. TaxID=1962974 RepID=UPI0017C31D80|nr:hypothetical protein [Geothrix sp.]NWJ42353.1 hypothetical protein [Geothrix sp.]WIL19680.1 MAG: hypothetical protein QOZ81_002207 [Geothrix sp.]